MNNLTIIGEEIYYINSILFCINLLVILCLNFHKDKTETIQISINSFILLYSPQFYFIQILTILHIEKVRS